MPNWSGVKVMRSVESPSVATEASDFLRLRLFLFLGVRKGDIATSINPKFEVDATEDRPVVEVAGDGGANDLEHWACSSTFWTVFITKLT